jgi:hypothetical protein
MHIMHMVWHQVPFDDLALFGQGVENCAQLPTRRTKDGLPPSFGQKYNLVLAAPF